MLYGPSGSSACWPFGVPIVEFRPLTSGSLLFSRWSLGLQVGVDEVFEGIGPGVPFLKWLLWVEPALGRLAVGSESEGRTLVVLTSADN